MTSAVFYQLYGTMKPCWSHFFNS